MEEEINEVIIIQSHGRILCIRQTLLFKEDKFNKHIEIILRYYI